MHPTRLAAACLAALLALQGGVAHALSGNEQVGLAGEGRYEELREGLEKLAARGPLKTRDLHAQCFAYSRTKRYNKLFPCLDRLAGNIAAGDIRTRLFGLDDATPSMHLMRAEAQLELANYPAALAEAKKALDWFHAEGEEDKDMALNALSLMSVASTLAGKRADGEKFARELDKIGTFTLTGNGYVSVKAMAAARAHMALGNYREVLDAFASDRMFALHAFLDRLVSGALVTGKNNWTWQELPRAFMTNRALQGIGELEQARRGYDRLLEIPQTRDNGEIYWQILIERGGMAEAEGKPAQAIDFYRKAIEVIEQQRSSISTESSKIGFVGDKQRVYERLINVLYAENRQTEAFEVIERSKSRALVDMLAARQASALHFAAPAGTVRLLEQFDEAELELVAQVPVSATEGKSTQRSAAVQAASRIQSVAPELGTLLTVSAMPASQVRASLPAGEALVQYYYHGPSLYASVYGATGIRMVRLDAAGLEEDIRQFRASIDKLEEGAAAWSRKLYDRLVRPLESELAQSESLLIIPHGALHYLPFGALHDGSRYLLDRYALRTLPSASVLPYLRAAVPRGPRGLLVLGNPDLGDSRLDLPSAQSEAERIAGQSGKARLLLRSEATETALKSAAADYPMLHIASHGVFDPRKPLDSALLLAKDGANDGRLTVGELYSMRLGAGLVTLSACETGLGQVNNGDDVVGLTRGFLYAGSSSVVASLWQVDDEATSRIMVRFYAELESRSKPQALRAAQLEIRKAFPHPYFWSAFTLTGSAQ